MRTPPFCIYFFAGALFLASWLLQGCTRTASVTVYGARAASFKVEIADTTLKRMKGLMFRKSLGQHEGMLFLYKDAEPRCFWMKHTKIPLDILFISEDKRVVNITEADPCSGSPCERHCSRGKVKYVLEINQGVSKENGFTQGTLVDI